jgi:hypothetical protein
MKRKLVLTGKAEVRDDITRNRTFSMRALSLLALAALFTLRAHAEAPPGPYFNGFEKNTNGWFDLSNGHFGHIARQPSGYTNGGGYADGINSAAGHWHARLSGDPCSTPPNQDCAGPNTNWGGYSSTFPPGGYLTQVDIYLDVNWAAAHDDVRFDWSSAINDNKGNFRRDFVFNVGTQLPLQSPHFIIQSSTNAFRSGANPNAPCPNPAAPPNSCRPPVIITTSGWYTFRHTFHDDGSGFLAVDFDIFPLGSSVPIMHQTIDSNPFDPMSMVGGNRYGWFANEEIPDLAIDNSLRVGLCESADGDGDVQGNDSSKGHFHFHKNTCENSGDDVEEDDANSGAHFQSTAINSATFVPDDNSETATIIGTGLHNGVPVGFTMVPVDNQGLAPAAYTLILTDGYVITGYVITGGIVLQ